MNLNLGVVPEFSFLWTGSSTCLHLSQCFRGRIDTSLSQTSPPPQPLSLLRRSPGLFKHKSSLHINSIPVLYYNLNHTSFPKKSTNTIMQWSAMTGERTVSSQCLAPCAFPFLWNTVLLQGHTHTHTHTSENPAYLEFSLWATIFPEIRGRNC